MTLSPRQCVAGALAVAVAPFVLVLLVHLLWSAGTGLGWEPVAAGTFAAAFGLVSWVGLIMAAVMVALDRWEDP